MNWRMFRRCWWFHLSSFYCAILTPWFAVQISSGTPEVWSGQLWYGIRACWNHLPGWDVREGAHIFRSEDRFLSWRGQR